MSGNIVIRPDDFAKTLTKALGKYGDEVLKTTDQAAKKAARATRADLKSSAPAGGDYARGWASRSQKEGAWGISQTVYNRDRYQLIHLMESPHDTGGGGHYPKYVDYTGTLARIEEEHTNKFMEEVLAKL